MKGTIIMIQDIYPKKLHNEFRTYKPESDDFIMVFDQMKLLVGSGTEGEEIIYPKAKDFSDTDQAVYLFSVDDLKYFLLENTDKIPEGFEYQTMMEIRRNHPLTNADIYAAYTAYHLYVWYRDNRFCGVCGTKTVHSEKERALVCPSCGHIIYPRINPAVIIGVINGERILLTRYNRGFAHNALVAGFCEIGETVEETVSREVMEEAGLKVKNIRYYKSQPWGVALDILMGFWCEVDGDDTITVDHSELKSAIWTERKDIVLQPNNYSLTNEMMKVFSEGRENIF